MFLALERSDNGQWQWVAGGGEADETPVLAAQRELYEELGATTPVQALTTVSPVPVTSITGELTWGADHLIVMEHAFCTDVGSHTYELSEEHRSARWVDYSEACAVLQFDSNRTAAWEVSALAELGKLD
jgi:dATP pyrophosphohydrolase